MAREITQHELVGDFARIMRGLDQGETFTLTRMGVPIGELKPLRRHEFVRAEAAVELFRTAAPVGYETLRSDLDGLVDQNPTTPNPSRG